MFGNELLSGFTRGDKMNSWQWKKKAALSEQLKFFGAKKQRFVSVYAKKPRIRIKVNRKPRTSGAVSFSVQAEQLSSLYQRQSQLGCIRNGIGSNDIAAAQQSMYITSPLGAAMAGGLGVRFVG